MRCHSCGFDHSHDEPVCPTCGIKVQVASKPTPTTLLNRIQNSATRRLVRLEECPRCRFLLFPADTVCSSCGFVIRTDMRGKANTKRAASGVRVREYAVPAAAVSVALLILAAAYFLLR